MLVIWQPDSDAEYRFASPLSLKRNPPEGQIKAKDRGLFDNGPSPLLSVFSGIQGKRRLSA